MGHQNQLLLIHAVKPTRALHIQTPKLISLLLLNVGVGEYNLKKSFNPSQELKLRVTHSMPPKKVEIFKCMEDSAKDNILTLLKPVEKC